MVPLADSYKRRPFYLDDVEIRLLIGLNFSSAVRLRDIVCGNENEPYAARSRAVNKYIVTVFRFLRGTQRTK